MASHRSPTPDQWLKWGAQKLAIDPSIFRERCDLFALVSAIEAGYVALPRGGRRETLAARLTNVLWRMLKRPPYKPAAREFAVALLEETALLNGFRLAISDRDRAVLAQETGRALSNRATVRDWLSAHLVELDSAEAHIALIEVMQRFGPLHREAARMFVSCASHGTDEVDPDQLAAIFSRIREAAQDAAEAVQPVWWSDSDNEHIDEDDRRLVGAMTVTMPIDDAPWAKDPGIHCPTNRRALWRANALVICGFGRGSHSTGCEHGEVPLCTPCLYVGRRGEPVPSAVAGALNLRQVEIREFDDPNDVPDIVAFWTRSHWAEIERAQRLTELRPHTFGPLASRFQEAFEPLAPLQAQGALRNAGVAPDLRDALVSVHGLATMSVETVQSAAAALGFHAPSFLDSAGEARLNDLQLDALSSFQHEYKLTPSNTSALRKEAERQQLLGVLRFSLTNLGEWRDFRDQLRNEAAG